MDNSTYYQKIEMSYQKEQNTIITTILIPLERTREINIRIF